MSGDVAVGHGNTDLIAAAIAVGKGTTKTGGSDFTAAVAGDYSTRDPWGLLIVTFTRAAGSASTLDFYFQVSHDGGTTWENFIDPVSGTEVVFSVATNHAVISGTTVRVARVMHLPAVSHVKLSKIVNGDGSNDLTAVNATLSIL